jgi:NADH:ubiquinone oxidoreductase subunit E
MKPRGKHIINVCTGTACFVKGAPRILQMISDELGIEIGDTTNDRQFSLSAVRCVGACSLAPVFVIGEETYGRIETRERLNEILNQYKA